MTEPSNKDNQGSGDSGEPGKGTAVYTEAQVQEMLKNFIENNEAYKSMQRAMSKLDRRAQQELSQKDEAIQALQADLNETTEGFEAVKELLLKKLDPDEREEVLSELREKRLQKLEKFQKSLKEQSKQAAKTPEDTDRQEELEELQRQYDQQLKAAIAECNESLRETVEVVGLDPNTDGLDYGDEKEPFSKRLKVLNKSVAKILKEQDDKTLNEVRGNARRGSSGGGQEPVPNDRGTFGGGPDLLSEGADELWRQLQKEARPAGRR